MKVSNFMAVNRLDHDLDSRNKFCCLEGSKVFWNDPRNDADSPRLMVLNEKPKTQLSDKKIWPYPSWR